MTAGAGHRIVVVGSSRGIGQGIAQLLCRSGARVVGVDRLDGAETRELAGERFASVSSDVADPDRVAAAFREVDDLLGDPPTGLVYCAGIAPMSDFLETSPAELEAVLAVNVKGCFWCGQEAARRMARSGGGRIVNIASTASVQGWVEQAAYGASKGAVAMLTRSMAIDLARHRIAVNAVAPGSIATPLSAELMSDPVASAHDLARTPLGRFGTPEDIAVAVRFLLLDARWMTGQVIYVDGGFLAAGGPRL